MASPQSSNKIASNCKWTIHDVDADYSTAAVVTSTVTDALSYGGFGVLAMSSLLAGNGITKVEIIGCTGSDGTGSITVIKDSGTVAADAVGDYVFLECTAEELRQEAADAGADLRYYAVRLTNNNSGDEAVISVLATDPRIATSGLTATTIS